MAKAFLDTNVLVYSVASADSEKERLARRVLESVEADSSAAISTQVLQELYSVLTVKRLFTSAEAQSILKAFEGIELVPIDRHMIYRAIDISDSNRIAFWDGLILAAAERGDCEVLLTEDLNHGQVIEGIRVENPFAEA